MGNGNCININSSTIKLNITGNGNKINGNYSNGEVYINGNGNTFLSNGGNLSIISSNGNGNGDFSRPINSRNNQTNSSYFLNPFMNQMFFGNGIMIGSSNDNRNISSNHFLEQNHFHPAV